MANVLFENKIIENKVKNFLNTGLSVSPFFTHDDSLTESAGLKKTVNVYSATGAVRDVAQGEGNQTADDINVTFTPVEYIVKYVQGRFPYFDEEQMKDPMLVDTGLQKMSANMVNDLTTKFYAELGKATRTKTFPKTTGIDYNTIVDAVSLFGENEEGLFMLINPTQKAELRKNLKDDLKYTSDIVRTGYIGTVINVPVYISDAVAADTIFIANKSAVTVFTKKEIETEQERDANLRKNIIYNRRCNVVALTDDTKVVKLTRALA